jgi:hypothetical protein
MKLANLAIVAAVALALVGAAQADIVASWSTPVPAYVDAWGTQFYRTTLTLTGDAVSGPVKGFDANFVPLGMDNEVPPWPGAFSQIQGVGGQYTGAITFLDQALCASDAVVGNSNAAACNLNDTHFLVYSAAHSTTQWNGSHNTLANPPYWAPAGSNYIAVGRGGEQSTAVFGAGMGLVNQNALVLDFAQIVFSGTGVSLVGTCANATGVKSTLNTFVTVVPDPATLSLLVIGGAGLLIRRKRS